MKFTVLQKNLIKGLNVVGKAVNPRSPLPILNNVLIKAENGRLKLTASDLSVIISIWVGAKVENDGEIAIPAKILSDFVNSILDEKIEGELDESKLTLKSDRFNAKFNGAHAADFPVLENYSDGTFFKIKHSELTAALSKIHFAVATDDTRPILTGFYFSIRKNGELSVLKIAGTDGFRMGEYTINLTDDAAENSFIIPAKTLFDIVKSLPSDSEEVIFYLNPSKSFITLKAVDIEAQIRLISGDYPDYENLVPKEYTTESIVEKSEFENSIKLVSVFAKDQGYAVKFKIENDFVEASSQPTELGSNVAKLSAIKEGDDITISFNGRFLLDFLSNVSSDKIIFKTLGPTKPGLFMLSDEVINKESDTKPKKDKGGKNNPQSNSSYWYLVMPIDVNW